MKICWDNLNKLKYDLKTNRWFENKHAYVYIDKCDKCGNPYLTYFHKISNFCSKSCYLTSRNPSDKTKEKISKSLIGRFRGENSPSHGLIRSEETKRLIRRNRKGKMKGKKHPNWSGGYYQKNIPLYNTYASQIKYAEKVKRNKENSKILDVTCTYCGRWYTPKRSEIQCRIYALNGTVGGEYRLYCSNECKKECSIYRKQKYSAEENKTKYLSREVQPQLRHLVFERDNWTCRKCGFIKSLHCHHIEGIRWEPLESADIDKCITYCKKCHRGVHRKKECGYQDMKCKNGK